MPRFPLPFRPAAAAAVAAAGLGAALPVSAGDVSLSGVFRQGFVADTNFQLEDGDSNTLGSLSSVSFSYVDQTPTSQLSLGTSFNYNFFSNEENDNISGLFPRLNGRYAVNRTTQSLNIDFRASVVPVDFFTNTNIILEDPTLPPDPLPPDGREGDDPLFPDDPDDPDDPLEPEEPVVDDPEPVEPVEATVRTNRETLRLSYGLGAGYTWRVNSRESLNLSLNGSRVDFLDNDGSLVPSTSLGFNGGWNRTLDSRLQAGVTGGVGVFLSDGDDNRTTVSTRLGPSLSWARTPRERYTLSLGPAFSVSSFDRRVNLPGGGQRVESVREETLSLFGSAGGSYSDGVSSWGLNLSQSVQPADEGAVVNATRLGFSYGRRVTATDRLSANASALFRTALGGDESSGFEDTLDFGGGVGWTRQVNTRNSFSLSANVSADNDPGFSEFDALDEFTVGVGAGWSWQILPELSANLSYSFRLQRERSNQADDEDLTSHRVSLTFTRPFSLLR